MILDNLFWQGFETLQMIATKVKMVMMKCDVVMDINSLSSTGTLREEENQLCRTVMGYWANFIRTG